MSDIRGALESERKVEQEFVAKALESERAPRGWPAALLMFHVAMWRERMRTALTDLAEGRSPTPPPPAEKQDEFNDAELASGIGTPLADAAARSDRLFGDLVDLYERVGDQPLEWYRSKTTTEAVLGNSYMHPRLHIYEYLRENGEPDLAERLWEDAAAELRAASAPALQLGPALYNLACVRTSQGRKDEAFELLAESFELHADLRVEAARDADLGPLQGETRFQDLLEA